MLEFNHIKNADALPCGWDELACNYFQQTKFLLHLEKFNACHQRYYVCFQDAEMVAAAIVYSLRLDLLTFLKIKSPLTMHIVGVPCSVSSSGIFGSREFVNSLKEHVYKVEKGFVLFLNLENKPEKGHVASGQTLPTVLFANHFKDWSSYVSSLRYPYRRRLNLIQKENRNLRTERIPCSEFNDEMYKQYLNVYDISKGKLERLNFEFFRHLPPEFKLTVCLKNDEIIGWNIVLEHENTYYFFLGGIDYTQNREHNTYFLLLASIIKDGIENNTELIELGQTAEIPKMRLGGKPKALYMEAHHSNHLINRVIRMGSPMLDYKRKFENTNAFKEENR